MATPPGISERDFARACRAGQCCRRRMGVHVRRRPEPLPRRVLAVQRRSRGSRPFGRGRAGRRRAGAGRRQDRQCYRIPLWTISTGRNLGYGGAAPAYSGSVIVDLKRMNRILEVNDKTHYAVVEPGVSYFDLYRYIQERGLKVWIDLPIPAGAAPWATRSSAAAAARRCATTGTPSAGSRSCLRSAKCLRTGMGAMPNSEVWHQYKYGFGPLVDGLFSQSNFGIVTRMGLWLMPSPEGYRDGQVNIAQHDDLVPFMETYAYLMNSDILRGTMLLESPLLNYHVTQGGSFFEMPNGSSIAELDRARARAQPALLDRGVALLGAAEAHRRPLGVRQGEVRRDPGLLVRRRPARVSGRRRRERPDARGRARYPVARRVRAAARRRAPRLLADHSDDGRSDLQSAARVRGALRGARLPPANQFAAYLGRTTRARSCCCSACRRRATPSRTGRAARSSSACRGLRCERLGRVRTHIAFMDKVAGCTRSTTTRCAAFTSLKDAVDPNGILSPGNPASGRGVCATPERPRRQRRGRAARIGSRREYMPSSRARTRDGSPSFAASPGRLRTRRPAAGDGRGGGTPASRAPASSTVCRRGATTSA